MAEEAGVRRDPRYHEPRVAGDPDNWAVVRFAQRFGEMREFKGKLYDLTPRAIRVVVTPENAPHLRGTEGQAAYVTFKIRSELPLTLQTAFIGRIDEMDGQIGVVLFFEMTGEPDQDEIVQFCEAFVRRYGVTDAGGRPADSRAEPQGPK